MYILDMTWPVMEVLPARMYCPTDTCCQMSGRGVALRVSVRGGEERAGQLPRVLPPHYCQL